MGNAIGRLCAKGRSGGKELGDEGGRMIDGRGVLL